MRRLTPIECRVLAVLVEKQLTVPDTYPLSLNALTAGCNQKTARQPVMELADAEVQQAVDELKFLNLVNQSSGSRVSRYEHNMQRGLGIPSQSVVLMALLMLRGPQTAAELRIHSERMHRFADVSSVEAFLDELAERGEPMVARLARAPGTREPRWTHLLGDMVETPVLAGDADGSAMPAAAAGELESLRVQQAKLAEEVLRMNALLDHLYAELGLKKPQA
jgi:uncharacterized protein YceH (UPF0502 family)